MIYTMIVKNSNLGTIIRNISTFEPGCRNNWYSNTYLYNLEICVIGAF